MDVWICRHYSLKSTSTFSKCFSTNKTMSNNFFGTCPLYTGIKFLREFYKWDRASLSRKVNITTKDCLSVQTVREKSWSCLDPRPGDMIANQVVVNTCKEHVERTKKMQVQSLIYTSTHYCTVELHSFSIGGPQFRSSIYSTQPKGDISLIFLFSSSQFL